MGKKEIGKKVLAYALTASGALGLAAKAQATIHYSGVKNLVVDGTHTWVSVDLNNDGTDDFAFSFNSWGAHTLKFFHGNASFIITASSGWVARLSSGYSIKPRLNELSWTRNGSILALQSFLGFHSIRLQC